LLHAWFCTRTDALRGRFPLLLRYAHFVTLHALQVQILPLFENATRFHVFTPLDGWFGLHGGSAYLSTHFLVVYCGYCCTFVRDAQFGYITQPVRWILGRCFCTFPPPAWVPHLHSACKSNLHLPLLFCLPGSPLGLRVHSPQPFAFSPLDLSVHFWGVLPGTGPSPCLRTVTLEGPGTCHCPDSTWIVAPARTTLTPASWINARTKRHGLAWAHYWHRPLHRLSLCYLLPGTTCEAVAAHYALHLLRLPACLLLCNSLPAAYTLH